MPLNFAAKGHKSLAGSGHLNARWVMVALAFFATVINYLDRQTLSVIAPVLREQLHMSNVDYSRVVFAFLFAYTISNGLSGTFIDRVGTKTGYAVCIVFWSAASILHAFAHGSLSLGIFRFLLGLGEAGNWPAGVKVVTEWFPARERALASGIFNSGSSVGAILAPPLVAWIALQFAWQTAFVVIGVTGFVWVAAWLLIYRSPSQDTEKYNAPPRISPWQLARTPWMLRFTLSKAFSDPAWYFYIFWFPQYLRSARGFDLASIGRYAWIPFVTAGFGNFFGGLLAAFAIRRGFPVSLSRKVCIVFFALLMTAAIPAVLVSNVSWSIALISLATMGYTGALANMLALPADNFPPHAVASVWGLASMGAGFGGMVFSLITGWVVEHYSYVPVFIGFGLTPLIAAAIVCRLPNLTNLPLASPESVR